MRLTIIDSFVDMNNISQKDLDSGHMLVIENPEVIPRIGDYIDWIFEPSPRVKKILISYKENHVVCLLA